MDGTGASCDPADDANLRQARLPQVARNKTASWEIVRSEKALREEESDGRYFAAQATSALSSFSFGATGACGHGTFWRGPNISGMKN
jgi:hypothetical protein